MVSFTRFARAASPSTTERGQEQKGDKRFSAVFTLPAQPQDSASPTPADEQNETTSAETDTTTEMSLKTHSTRVRMDRRFSTLFTPSALPSRPSTPPSHDETPWTFPPKPKLSQRKNLKLLFRRIFSSTPSSTRDETNARPFTSEELGSRLWADMMGGGTPDPSVGTTLPPPATSTKQRSQTTVVVLPSLRASPRKSRPKSGVEIVGILQSSGNKRADSKFSSITSLPSLQSLSLPSLPTSNCSGEGGIVNIWASGLLMVESCIRRIERGLERQEYLASHLSNNLIHLFTKRETQLQMLRRLRPDEQNSLLSSLARIKDLTSRTFLRKAVFLQRSREVRGQICEILKSSRSRLNSKLELELELDAGKKGDEREGGDGDGDEGEGARGRGSSLIEVEDRIFDLLRVLAEDVNTQRELDAGLRKLVLGAAGEKKWNGGSWSEGERTLLAKFCAFVEGRLGVVEEVYARVEMCVRRMEGV